MAIKMMGRYGKWHGAEDISYEEIKVRVKFLLEKASKGNAVTGCCGVSHIPILVDSKVIGELQEDVEIKDLEVGAYKYGKRGIKAQLVKDGRVVGFLWLQ